MDKCCRTCSLATEKYLKNWSTRCQFRKEDMSCFSPNLEYQRWKNKQNWNELENKQVVINLKN